MLRIKRRDLKPESFLMAEWELNIKQVSIKHSTVEDVYKMVIRCPSCLVGANKPAGEIRLYAKNSTNKKRQLKCLMSGADNQRATAV